MTKPFFHISACMFQFFCEYVKDAETLLMVRRRRGWSWSMLDFFFRGTFILVIHIHHRMFVIDENIWNGIECLVPVKFVVYLKTSHMTEANNSAQCVIWHMYSLVWFPTLFFLLYIHSYSCNGWCNDIWHVLCMLWWTSMVISTDNEWE